MLFHIRFVYYKIVVNLTNMVINLTKAVILNNYLKCILKILVFKKSSVKIKKKIKIF